MKYIIGNDDYEVVVKNLQQAQSLAYILGSNINEDSDKTNVYWIIQELVQYAKDLVVNSERLTN